MNCTGKDPLLPKPTEMVCSSIGKTLISLKRPNFLLKSLAISLCVLVLNSGSIKRIRAIPELILVPPKPGTAANTKSFSGTLSLKKLVSFSPASTM